MSWQEYVDTNLVGSGKVSRAAIIGLAGSVWACTPGFTLSAEEQRAIVNGFSQPDAVQTSGLRLAGQKYFTISANSQSIYLKQKADGAVLVKTKQAVLVAEYKAPIQAGEATPVVEQLGDYLRGVNY
ncbi:hypothetical protein E1B28_012232 [Marasmius oreades]|uniref:Profilin n=1 Tax=Marasmius oreades TaxID=181124 RepID=A0A9P7RR84_9AGAR|nr:uncharacterized protein E1B28_012232 [Marasmius oreades]KAG7088215.1 hypothetical protein E1B28_012232 [Marasmius oreades]